MRVGADDALVGPIVDVSLPARWLVAGDVQDKTAVSVQWGGLGVVC